MYQLLPFVSAYTALLPSLPVEMWCLIFRLLDADTLLVMVRTSNFFWSVAQGDLTLKNMVADAIKQEQKQIFSLLTQPGMSIRVSRNDYARLFGTNVQKVATIKHHRHAKNVDVLTRPKTTAGTHLGPTKKSSRNRRFNPYR